MKRNYLVTVRVVAETEQAARSHVSDGYGQIISVKDESSSRGSYTSTSSLASQIASVESDSRPYGDH